MIEISRNNPRRPTDWRWQRACLLVESSDPQIPLQLNRTQDDEWIRKAANFKRALDGCQDEAEESIVLSRNEDLYWAYDIYQDAGNAYKSELEARLLSRSDHEDISLHIGTSSETVKFYEKLFYNVEDKLDTSGYVYHTAIGREMHRGFTEREFDKLWKWYAYTYGPLMLNSLLGQVVEANRPATSTEIKAAWKDDGMGSIIRKQAIAARTMPVNSFTQVDLLHIWTKFVEIEKSAEAASGGSGALIANVEAFLEIMPKMLVGKRVKDTDFPAMEGFDAAGHELRTHELMMLATGEAPPGLEDTLKTLKFPEVTSHEKIEQGS
jgi:hypothetical protein